MYERYQELCQVAAFDPRTSRRVRDFLADLVTLNITLSSQRNDGLSGGNYRHHELKHDVTKVLNAMSDLVERVGIHQSIDDLVTDSDSIIVSK